jgi:hypothetical protein
VLRSSNQQEPHDFGEAGAKNRNGNLSDIFLLNEAAILDL